MKKEIFLSVLLLAAIACSDDNPLPLPDGSGESLGEGVGRNELQSTEQDRITLHTRFKDILESDKNCCDSVEVANFKDGHRCCVTGTEEVWPGQIHTFRYQTSKDPHPFVNWEVTGDIEIIDDQHTIYLTVKFGPDFTNGEIVGRGNATVFAPEVGDHILRCDTRISVQNPRANPRNLSN
jgi:hypothetical protein